MKKFITLGISVLLLAVLLSGCAVSLGHSQALTGSTAHERHATGLDSQTGLY